ncbi:adenylate kinase-like protein 2 [Plasmodium gonderi]|uniref:Adenylate kinase-like protein 2 n=1 Tax=Plasmodium gonderi TaxID=77519 RepID=A0A1Y1JK06_PLAGO|nr:adenylate kinase-like protein 2 [Plasmodium gonderi]GAW80384.1 adenylate kinase-like protein 2 [Plasmodium gonderi]
METLLDSETLKNYEKETNEYIRKKKVEKLFDVILKNVLINKPENVYLYIYKNIYSFLLNKIFIIGPPLLKITPTLCSAISSCFSYYHLSISHMIESYMPLETTNDVENSPRKKLASDDLICSIVKRNINNLNAKQRRGFVVEGFPSTNLQAHSCLQHLPSYIFVLYADEEYIYEQYEKESRIKICSDMNNQTYDENSELFEMAEIDTHPLKDEVKVYLRNISGVLSVLGDRKEVLNLRDYDENGLIEHNKIGQTKDEWNCVFDDYSVN